MKEIRRLSAEECNNFSIGHASDQQAGTGVTVLYFPNGARVGCDISGGGPASRETPLASPVTADNPVNAVVLSGGSAFGLAASDGVMSCLEERGIGFDTGFARVPLVLQSCIYDLGYGSAKRRPDAAMGREAAERALAGTDGSMGNVGCGTGATVGKLFGMRQAQKCGFGFFAAQAGELVMAAVVAVNALGDIFDPETGEKIAGLRNPERTAGLDLREQMYRMAAAAPSDAHRGESDMSDARLAAPGAADRDISISASIPGNTTIGAVITNGAFSKAEMKKIASMARNAYARCIRPVGTMADGDTIYGISAGSVHADINLAGVLAADVMARAIREAVRASAMPEEDYLKMVTM